MIRERFAAMTAKVEESLTLSSRQKKDLSDLLSALGREIEIIAARDEDGAVSLAGFIECAVHESARSVRSSPLALQTRKGFLLAARPYEDTDPSLTPIANAFADALSSLGL